MGRFSEVPAQEPPSARTDDWVGLGEAARLLGVTPNTIRRWSDSGHVASFTTPGGHRRFPRAAIEALLPAPHHRRPQLADLGASGDAIAAAYRRTSPGGEVPAWMDEMTDADRERFRTRGRSMVECLVAYIDADRPAPALANLRQARDHADDYGAHIAHLGATLREAVDAYVRFRLPFLEELQATARSRSLDVGAATDLLVDAESAMDQLLVAFIDGWQRGEP
ncbi:MAG: helix-turn-helix domain-containing protein [Candidatus Dormiibacterota bacterium]